MDKAIVIPNITKSDVRIKRMFHYLECNAINAKSLGVNIFEMGMKCMLYDCGFLVSRDIEESAKIKWARQSAPSYGLHMTEDEVDDIIAEEYDNIVYVSEEINRQIMGKIQPIIQRTVDGNRRFNNVTFYYDVPSVGSITMHLRDE